MYEDVYVPSEREIEQHLRLWGLPATPPVKAPPRTGRQAEEAREEELRAQVEAEVQRRAEVRMLEMLDPTGDFRRGLLEGDPWQEAPPQGGGVGESGRQRSGGVGVAGAIPPREEVRGGGVEGRPGPVREIRMTEASRPEDQSAPITDSNIPPNTPSNEETPRGGEGGGTASQPDSMLNVTGAVPEHGNPERRQEEP